MKSAGRSVACEAPEPSQQGPHATQKTSAKRSVDVLLSILVGPAPGRSWEHRRTGTDVVQWLPSLHELRDVGVGGGEVLGGGSSVSTSTTVDSTGRLRRRPTPTSTKPTSTVDRVRCGGSWADVRGPHVVRRVRSQKKLLSGLLLSPRSTKTRQGSER